MTTTPTTKTDMMTPMMKLTTLPSLQKGRTMSAAAINQYKQKSTVQAGGGNNVEEEKWQMGR
jgi:hypothetical protein